MTSTTTHHDDSIKKDAKSAILNSQEDALGLMHDQHFNNNNNKYHSSLYRHQSQSRQQQHHSYSTNETNLITSTHSCGSPCHSPLSMIAADPARPHSTPSCYSHTNNNNYKYETLCMDNSIDLNSLCEAMNDDDDDTTQPPTTTVIDDDVDDGHDSFNTMLSYMRKNDELVQQMDEIEQLESLSFLRVMYLGVATAQEKQLFLKKLSDGLSESLFRQSPTAPPPPPSYHTTATISDKTTTNNNNNTPPPAYGFREQKHHLLPLHLFLANNALDNDYYDDHAATFEDNGVSIVEADFSTDNNNLNDSRKYSPDLILHYIYTQYQHYDDSLSTLNTILNPPPSWVNQRFNGHVFSQGAPNGIDLCVYFYHDAQKMTDVTQDMDLLWKINTLGIPVLPIMSMSDQTRNEHLSPTTTDGKIYPSSDDKKELDTDDDDDDDDIYEKTTYVKQRPIDVRRNELAYMFSQWRIKMMDISNLDSIGQPSFQQRGNTRKSSTQQDMAIEQRLGQAWATSSMTSPTPYHILTLFQFMAMDRWAVSKLLKTIQDQAGERCYSGDGNQPANDNGDTHFDDDDNQVQSSMHTSTDSRQQQQQQQQQQYRSISPPLSYTTNDTKVASQYNDLSTSEPLPQLLPQKEKLVTVHLWLLYALPLFLLLVFGIWIALTGIFGGIMAVLTQHHQHSTLPWYASLMMVSHQTGISVTLMVNVYDGQHQPRWAPEPPLLWTNLHLPSIDTLNGFYSHTWKDTSTLSSSSAASIHFVAPLLNKTQSLEGQYVYSILLPSCSSWDPDVQYTVQIKPSTILLPTIPGTVQGSPIQLPRYVLCDPIYTHRQEGQQVLVSTGDAATDDDKEDLYRRILEALNHCRQHSRFYFVNSLKIMEYIFTGGKEED